MFVLTVDQVDSRHRPDGVEATLRQVRSQFRGRLARPPRRTAGDEFQTAVTDPATALDLCLLLTRDSLWNVGCGIGAVDEPLPKDVNAGSGPAFVAARTAVDRAKKSPSRCVVTVATDYHLGAGVGPLLDLLLFLRGRRTAEGWEVYDLLRRSGDVTQRQVAAHLGISGQAVSSRIRAAEIRAEQEAIPPLVQLFAEADAGDTA